MSLLTFLKKAVGTFDPYPVALESYEFWRSVGYDHDGACAWLGNEDGEDSFDNSVAGDHGEAHGPAQHHQARIDVIKAGCGIDILTASHLDQLKAIDWESSNAPGYRQVKQHVMAAPGRRAKVSVIVTEFERSQKQERDIDRRTRFADYWSEKIPADVSGRDPHPVALTSVESSPALGLMATPGMELPPLKWVPSPNISSRKGQKVDLIVVHSCQGTYHGSVNWFANPDSEVSAHLVVDEHGAEVTQCVRFSDKAWHVCAFNSRSIGVEMAGWAEKGFEQAEWTTEAKIVAYLCHKYGIPAEWSKIGARPGFCRHFDLGRAGGGHHDPTEDERIWTEFVMHVQQYYKAGGFPAAWGKD